MENKFVEFETVDGFLKMTLNRPDKGNCLSPEMVKAITDSVLQHCRAASSKGIVITGKGKNFCTGADLEWVRSEDGQDFSLFLKMYEAFLQCDLPIVAVIQGKAFGGGLGLASICDITLCEDSASFALPEAGLGLVPGALTPIVMQRIGVSRFKYLSILSRVATAAEALSWGLVHEVISPKNASLRLEEILKEISKKSLNSIKSIKQGARLCAPLLEETQQALAKMSNDRKASAEAKGLIDNFLKNRTKGSR